MSFEQTRANPAEWGQWVETAIGVHPCQSARLGEIGLFYWREGNDEVDFVMRHKQQVIGLEVKSGRTQSAPGMTAFQRRASPAKSLLIGNSGIPWVDFLRSDVKDIF